MVKYVLKNVMADKYTYEDYLKMWGSDDKDDIATKEIIDDHVREELISKIIIEGSNDKFHQSLRSDLEKDFTKGHDNYPHTSSGALDLMNQYRVKTPKKHTQTPPNQMGGKGEKKNGTTQQGGQQNSQQTSNSNKVTAEEAHMLLMKGVHDGIDSEEEFLFANYGRKNKENDDDNGDDGETQDCRRW